MHAYEDHIDWLIKTWNHRTEVKGKMMATAEDYKKAFETMWKDRNELSERFDQAVKAALDAQAERDRAIVEADEMRRERNQARREAEEMHHKYCDLYGWGWNEPVFSWQKEEKCLKS